MRICLLLITLLLFVPLAAAAKEAGQPRAFMNDAGLYGFKTPDGEVHIAPRFDLAGDFSSQGIAEVVDDQGWAIIDLQGDVLFRPFVFDNGPDPFSEGLARFVQDGKIGFFNKKGQVVIPARFTFAAPFYNGKAAFCEGCEKVHYGEHWSMEGGLWGCIDSQGTVVREPGRGPQNCSDP